ncbi:MAG: cobalamin-binding protein [Deltaproteobacteria bacterium]|nr:cobalamin-binding protein [Deltaproteobacteria bacterium]MBI4795538.1 cobalamin-binding protein [Deltaproteobacteria bacterium]
MRFCKDLRKVILFAVWGLLAGFFPWHVLAAVHVDHSGRRVNVPASPQRLVTMAASLTEMVFALGLGSRVRGVEQFSDYPPAAKALPKVGSYKIPDVERIVALRPDLCLAIKDGNPPHVLERLRGLGIPVYVVDPRNLQGVIATIKEIGDLLGAAGKARELATALTRRHQRIKDLAAQAAHRPRVFFQIGVSPIVSAGSHTFLDELISTAGGLNLAAGKVPYPRFSQEQILALQPEVIIITSMDRGGAFEQVKAGWERWETLPAARHHRIFLVDSDIMDRPSPRLLDGLDLLFRLIHPELAGELK